MAGASVSALAVVANDRHVRRVEAENRRRTEVTTRRLEHYVALVTSFLHSRVPRLRENPTSKPDLFRALHAAGFPEYEWTKEARRVSLWRDSLASPSDDFESLFSDAWARPLVYLCPGDLYVRGWELRSFGANGIDEGGQGDDIVVGVSFDAEPSTTALVGSQ